MPPSLLARQIAPAAARASIEPLDQLLACHAPQMPADLLVQSGTIGDAQEV
ncbi:hypothetical protein CTP10_R11050 [Cupriavidus sp. P-10]|uniref:hypothetical protein n=1 Tax=Cupriavidus sp. P-10 TaxID=2027911 RepID=UPI001314A7B4|nr:hypothetical protein [Cupriavidus sp. P-10]BDB23768.1 hypothetical protein CTP10_R11050 [Cupriavidus sp. P-10]